MSYVHLWLDIVAGLKKEGWRSVGGNFDSYIIMKKKDSVIKVFIRNKENLKEFDLNHIIVRYS